MTTHPDDQPARAEILTRIRTALSNTSPASQPAPARAPAHTSPEYRRTGEHAPGSAPLLDLFTERLTDYRATVHRTTPALLVDTITEALAGVLPPGGTLVVPPGLPPDWSPGATIDTGQLTATELDRFDAVLTGCAAAAAETGTIALDSGPGQGRRALSLIPDRHLCVVRADQVVQTVPELLARLDPTRPLTLVSGPSATSDIELSRVEGVHGPRTLVVILVAG